MSHSSCVLSKDVIPQWNLTTAPCNTVITNDLNSEVKFDRVVLGMVCYRRNSVPYEHHMNNFFTTFTLQKNQAKWPNKFQQNLMFLRTIRHDESYDILWTIQQYFL